MNDRNSSRRFPRYAAPRYAALWGLLIAMAMLTSGTLAQNGVTDRGVQKRMNTMADARTAIGTLADMMGGRTRFDSTKARAARKNLIVATRSIPSVFKKPHSDPLSRARPDIWIRWDDFKARANAAERAARRLNTGRLGALRSTLPAMVNACLGCHRTYRRPR